MVSQLSRRRLGLGNSAAARLIFGRSGGRPEGVSQKPLGRRLRNATRERILPGSKLAERGLGGRIRRKMLEDSLSEEERLALREQVERLREEHRDLDVAIDALADAGQADRLQIQRLKKRKLVLRDRLKALEDVLTPDIIA